MIKNNLKIHYEIKPSFTTRKIKELEQENKHLDEVNCKLRRRIGQLEDNWNYIKKMLKEARQEKFNVNGYCGTCTDVDIDFLLNKMQELEQGSDSNVKD